jgi:prepilin-type N-terminal cleavage/methylation domain-containing protein
MNSPIKNRATKGFTLVEIMLVVIAIGILVAMLMPRFGNVVGATTTNSTANDVGVANRVLENFEMAGGTFGGSSTATQINNTSAATAYADLKAGKTLYGITYSLPTTAPATIPSSFAASFASNRFH